MQSKETIQSQLNDLWIEVENALLNVSDTAANTQSVEGVWSPAQELRHMNLSAEPVAKALFASADQLFNPEIPTRNGLEYDELNEKYWSVINSQQVNAPARFRADGESFTLSVLLEDWNRIGAMFQKGIPNWNEEDLDKIQLRHPVLDYLTFREMLMFTHIHSSHHFRRIREKLQRLTAF
ncbi:MAG: hypothetical protein GC181_11955 [Bacteroidetes bacterium]|nr:hypothetical protein [Bacteroidota bacterium]